MAVNTKTELTVVPWRYAMPPANPDAAAVMTYLVKELDRLQATLSALVNAANQATDVAPKNPLNGMVRYAEGAWGTALGGNGLYVYKAGTWTHIV